MPGKIIAQDFSRVHGAFFGYLKGYAIYAKLCLEKKNENQQSKFNAADESIIRSLSIQKEP